MQIGSKPKQQPDGITELLLECHERIRSFIALAIRLGEVKGAPAADIQDAAHRVLRYFEEALPLHVEDEEESILPRLRGRDPGVDASLQQMHEEHVSHAPRLARLLSICRLLTNSPEEHSGSSEELVAVATELEREFRVHLQNEENTIIPALARFLSAEEQDEIVAELRARRTAPNAETPDSL